MSADVEKVRVMVVDDHLMVRQGIASLLARRAHFQVVAEAGDAAAAMSAFRLYRPDVTLMDLRLPGMGGADVIEMMVREFPDARFIVLTTYDSDEEVFRALRAGARGYLLKGMSAEELVEAVEAVHAGRRAIPPRIAERAVARALGPDLTAYEMRVLERMGRGLSNQEIADELELSVSTVKGHVTKILAKLGATARTEAVIAAVQRGLVRLD